MSITEQDRTVDNSDKEALHGQEGEIAERFFGAIDNTSLHGAESIGYFCLTGDDEATNKHSERRRKLVDGVLYLAQNHPDSQCRLPEPNEEHVAEGYRVILISRLSGNLLVEHTRKGVYAMGDDGFSYDAEAIEGYQYTVETPDSISALGQERPTEAAVA